MNAFNRRKYVRVRLNCLVKFNVAGSSKIVKKLTNLADLSEGGVRLSTFEEKLPPKSEVQIEFRLPPTPKIISVKGKVMRSYSRGKGSYVAGVQFKELSAEDLQLIKDYIKTKTKLKRR